MARRRLSTPTTATSATSSAQATLARLLRIGDVVEWESCPLRGSVVLADCIRDARGAMQYKCSIECDGGEYVSVRVREKVLSASSRALTRVALFVDDEEGSGGCFHLTTSGAAKGRRVLATHLPLGRPHSWFGV